MVTDNELIGKFLYKDDTDAFEQLIRRHSGLVMGVCRGMLLQTQDAEDAFQATFLILSRKAKSLTGHGSIAGWLYQTAVRNCLQVRRRRYRGKETEMLQEPIHVEEPWQTISLAQENELVYREINRLPKRYRDVILLFHLNGHTRAEVAELLDWTESAVKAALARARNLLRKRLIRRGIFTSAILTALNAATVKGQEFVSDPLISSALELCQGISPTVEVGTSSQFVRSIANHGVMSMHASYIIKSVSLAAALMISIAIPLGLWAQQVAIGNRATVVGLTGVKEKVSRLKTEVNISNENKTGSSDNPVNTSDSDSRLGDDMDQLLVNAVNEDPDHVMEIRESLEYWELILKSYRLQAEGLRAQIKSTVASQQKSLLAEALEYEAKAVEAKLNLRRIRYERKLASEAGQQDFAVDKPKYDELWRSQLAQLMIQRGEMSVNFGQNHPHIQSIDKKIEIIKQYMEDDINAEETTSSEQNPPQDNAQKKSVPPASTAIVQPGEVLLVESMTNQTLNRRVVVQADHTISLPMVGTVNVNGMNLEQVQERLNEKFSVFVKDPDFFVGREVATTPLRTSER